MSARDQISANMATRALMAHKRTIAQLQYALEESVKLQNHYAGLLNDYDGGCRMRFQSARAWLKRLDETGRRSAGSAS